MNRYFNLLTNVATEYHIQKGTTESELAWKARIVYSLLSQMGYSSLYDTQDDLKPASIVHLKTRITKGLGHLMMMYPELVGQYDTNDNTLPDELYSLFLNNGCIYHEPNRIRPCVRRIGQGRKCAFMRGQAVAENKWISGSGCYRLLKENEKQEEGSVSFEEMFSLQTHNLLDSWENVISNVRFASVNTEIGFEYLRTKGPYKNGYWVNTPDASGIISIARTTLEGKRIYYLYKQENDEIQFSQLPEWMTDDYNYRSIAISCLYARETLPPTEYHIDGPIVTLQIGYLFAPSELNFIKLYSWPTAYRDFPHDFRRVMSIDVFEELKYCLNRRGYRFKEV